MYIALLLSSCDDGDDKPYNYITFDGTKYVINNSQLTFVGEADLRHQDTNIGATHYQHSIRFTDGSIDPTNEFYIEGGKFKVTFSLFTTINDHSQDAITGNYEPVHPQDFFGSKAPLDKSFFTFFILRVDDDGNGIFDQGETWYDGVTGSVSIGKSGESYTVSIDTGDTHTGKYANGNFVGEL